MLPTLVLRNQFGEVSNNVIEGGSSQISCTFKVAAADAGGKGITGLSATGISAVYMHTSSTPSANNPNPVAGLILVEFAANFSSIQSVQGSIQVTPLSGSSINISSGLTLGKCYVITAVGTSTATNWQALGLPVGVTPAVGVPFIATSASAGTGTGTVQVAATAGTAVDHFELIASAPSVSSGLPYAVLQAMTKAFTYNSGTPASSTVTDVLGAPADGTIITLKFTVVPLAAPVI